MLTSKNSHNISRINKNLDAVRQDFLHELKQMGKVAAYLKEGTEQQKHDIINSMAYIENFNDAINEIYEKSQSIIALAYEMERTNQYVQESFDQLVMNQATNEEALQNIFNVIKNLIERTDKIGQITSLINRISNETNLLGLNAKVEAVHAGTAGRGFSVVANEIQRLSEESKTASGNINETIKGITDEIALLEEVALVAKDTFKAQWASVDEVKSAFDKNSEFISTYVNEQKRFNESIAEIKEDESILVDSISNVFSSVREVSAATQEILSLNYNQNNSITLLTKLNMNLSGEVIAKKKRKIAIVFENENPFWEPMKLESVKAAAVYDYEVEFFAPKNRGKQGAGEMVDILDTIIKGKYDGMILSPINEPLIVQRLKELNKIGTKIVFINEKIDTVDYVSLIHTDGIMTGAVVAHIVMGILGNQGQVIVNSWTDSQLSVVENRRIGFVRELNNNPNIIVHEVGVPSKASDKEADQMIGSIFKNYPEVKVVFLTNFDWGLFFANYKKRHNADFQIIVVDYIEEVENALKEGLINYAIGQRAYSWGTMAIGFIEDCFMNKLVPKVVDTGTYEVNHQTIKIYKDS